MARKRQRPGATDAVDSRKRLKASDYNQQGPKEIEGPSNASHPVLDFYYPRVSSLRTYLISKLPPNSRSRRRKVEAFPTFGGDQSEPDTPASALSRLLDTTLVGAYDQRPENLEVHAGKDVSHSRQGVDSTTHDRPGRGTRSQSEIVDHAVWTLFNETYKSEIKPPHLLCYGYQRASCLKRAIEHDGEATGTPGLLTLFANANVSYLKSPVWVDLLALLGQDGEHIMLRLILDCGLFTPVQNGIGNLIQLSGTPLADLNSAVGGKNLTASKSINQELRKKGSVTFVRSRILYARPDFNGKGQVRVGIRHIHALNRFSESSSLDQTVHLMKYLFPRQFGLHNVFTSDVDRSETAKPFVEYSLREDEILRICPKPKIPKRLRGQAVELTRKLQRLHTRCSYTKMLDAYCPRVASKTQDCSGGMPKVSQNSTATMSDGEEADSLQTAEIDGNSLPITRKPEDFAPNLFPATLKSSSDLVLTSKKSFMEFASPVSQVSAFCRAVLSKVIPNDFWGAGLAGSRHKELIMNKVHIFIRLGRFESLTLHEVMHGIKITEIPWIAPSEELYRCKVSQSDITKRQDIFSEFVYYVFDSLLIPLIRSNFYVTESGAHRNRLFYFRHDTWRALSEPSLASLKASLFSEVGTSTANEILAKRAIGVGHIRLLPKANGIRPIMNLRRRGVKKQNGRTILGRSINSVMGPVQNVLSYERTNQPGKLGASMFSVGDQYPKLSTFKSHLKRKGYSNRILYFAKVDVQSAFDTIPQQKVVQLVEELLSASEYRLNRHVEIKAPDAHQYGSKTGPSSKPTKRFLTKATSAESFFPFAETVTRDLAPGKKNTVFVDQIVHQLHDRDSTLDLLDEHIRRNLVKIGNKLFIQRKGIPQGSVVSSLLCNFFYAELERNCLNFLSGDTSILLRLIDDFLLVTIDYDHARRFLQVMHNGNTDYGVAVNPDKSLVNFDVMINGKKVPRHANRDKFPYCGNLLDTRTLDLSKDRSRLIPNSIADSLTVETSKVPGKSFHKKALNAFKIQTHAMFLDTSINSQMTVLTNVYQNFVEAAMKLYRYMRALPSVKRPKTSLIVATIQDMMELAFVLTKSKQKKATAHTFQCAVSKSHVQGLALIAFQKVLGRKQCQYGEVLEWLERALPRLGPKRMQETRRLRRAAQIGDKAFGSLKY